MEKITYTNDDVKVLFYQLYRLENHFECRNMTEKEKEISQIIRKLNDLGVRE